MKRVNFFFCACIVQACLWAQPAGHFQHNCHGINRVEQMAMKQGYRYKLTEFHTDDLYQFNNFYYDEYQRLVAVKDSVRGDYSLMDSLFYNDLGQVVRMSGWQLLDGGWENVYYIDYAYDAAGNISSRTNYNNFGGTWELGGVYTYTYNSDNQIVLSVLTMAGIQYQKVEYTYVDGRLNQELWYGFNGYGLSSDEKLTYSYNVEGQLVQKDDSVNDGGSRWSYSGKYTYLYDNSGNCTECHYYDNTGMEAERSVFRFNEAKPLTETLMPWTPEMTRPATFENTAIYEVEQWYSVDVDHHLQYVCDFLYTYEDVSMGIRNIVSEPLREYPNPAKEWVTLVGLPDVPCQLQVVDEQGRVRMSTIVSQSSNKVYVKSLPSGCYILRLMQQGTLRTSVLVVE